MSKKWTLVEAEISKKVSSCVCCMSQFTDMHLSAPILLHICTQLQCGILDVNISCHNAGVMHIHLHPIQLFTCRTC